MEIPIYIGDTECIAQISDDNSIAVFALDGGGPQRGPRRIGLTRQLVEDLTALFKKIAKDIKDANRGDTPRTDTDIRGDIPTPSMGVDQA